MPLSISATDRLGDRLAKADPTDEDLLLLGGLRDSHRPALEQVMSVLADHLGLEPVGRPKTNYSIIAKVRRRRTRLSRMQDIAGCRVVVDNYADQDQVVRFLLAHFEDATPDDLRKKPSNHYRAVHVMVVLDGRTVEVQVRTEWQHKWADLSEKLADKYGLPVKYGEGPVAIHSLLKSLSEKGAEMEELDNERPTLKEDDPGRVDLDARLNTIRMDLEREIAAGLVAAEREERPE